MKKETLEITYSITDINSVLAEYKCFVPNEGCNCKIEKAAVVDFLIRLESRRQSNEECQRLCKPLKDSTKICKHGNAWFVNAKL